MAQSGQTEVKAVWGARYRSGFAADDHARLFCLARSGDYCALKRKRRDCMPQCANKNALLIGFQQGCFVWFCNMVTPRGVEPPFPG